VRNRLLVAALAVAGLLVAASIGYGAYLASRDSVGLPVTKLEPKPRDLAPTVVRRRARTGAQTPHATSTLPLAGTTTVDDHGGRSRGGSGRGGGGGGGGDD
jgi:hypothetical protein